MKPMKQIRIAALTLGCSLALPLGAALLVAAAPATAQTPAAARLRGTVTAINGTTLELKTDTGEVKQVEVPESAVLKQVAPGEKDLAKAEALDFKGLAAGDRVLVKLDASATGGTLVAAQVVAIKQADLAKKQLADREDWQKRGAGGLVKSVDTATGDVAITTGAGQSAKTIMLHTTKASVLKRYAPASVRFDEAKVAPLAEIKAGDQIRARGTKSADGLQIAVEEEVSGSFRNIAGQVISLDAVAGTLTVKDLSTKKPATIKFTSESQLHKLPDMMATRLAAFLKSGAAAAPAGAPGAASAPAAAPMQAGGQRSGFGGQRGGFGGAADPQTMLSRAPVIQLAELKKGDAVMLVATDGGSDLTAVTLMAGVEPLLEAPAASNLLSNWSMSSGGSDAGQ